MVGIMLYRHVPLKRILRLYVTIFRSYEGSEKMKQRVSELLTLEERADFFEAQAKMYKSKLLNDLSGSEYKRLYHKASNILLAAIERELVKRGLA
jgi:hypothetical protein